MRKLLKGMLFAVIFIFSLSSTVFAASTSRLEASMRSLGLSDSEIANVIEYLQEINMTTAQEDSIHAYIDEGEAVAGGATDLTTLSVEQKQQLRVIAQKAAQVVGLNAVFTTDSTGKQVLSLQKTNGGILLSLTAENAKNVQWSVLKAAVTEARIYSQEVAASRKGSGSTSTSTGTNAAKGKYSPKSGSVYCKTATNTGNLLLVGSGLMVLSGILFIYRKGTLEA